MIGGAGLTRNVFNRIWFFTPFKFLRYKVNIVKRNSTFDSKEIIEIIAWIRIKTFRFEMSPEK
jgi:hypothetical protein